MLRCSPPVPASLRRGHPPGVAGVQILIMRGICFVELLANGSAVKPRLHDSREGCRDFRRWERREEEQMNTTLLRNLAVAISLGAVVAMSGCGGGSGTRPDAEGAAATGGATGTTGGATSMPSGAAGSLAALLPNASNAFTPLVQAIRGRCHGTDGRACKQIQRQVRLERRQQRVSRDLCGGRPGRDDSFRGDRLPRRAVLLQQGRGWCPEYFLGDLHRLVREN